MKTSVLFYSILLSVLLGLSGASLAELKSLGGKDPIAADAPAPKLVRFINDKENIPKTFEQQPPLAPHRNEKYTVNLSQNECLDCHQKEKGEEEAKSVPMPESHYADAHGKILDEMPGRRYFCNQCHVSQIEAEPLVGNNFQTVQ
ncbi:MAG: nitrate reductase cytochrome c-type subunit [Gammaproteobacteria bacterium SHHR-1]|uniref:nitrate reductase cytochrome c-type subunit n=1 Tax=Magnetovirga frankeli TaxID=947516 RepID=UPI0012939354|nr:nitrate reductase cytochrome c-type subunit [gamma proteobacterium SS-5]